MQVASSTDLNCPPKVRDKTFGGQLLKESVLKRSPSIEVWVIEVWVMDYQPKALLMAG